MLLLIQGACAVKERKVAFQACPRTRQEAAPRPARESQADGSDVRLTGTEGQVKVAYDDQRQTARRGIHPGPLHVGRTLGEHHLVEPRRCVENTVRNRRSARWSTGGDASTNAPALLTQEAP
jgi:hypothetical protein